MKIPKIRVLAVLLAVALFGCSRGSGDQMSSVVGTWSGVDQDENDIVIVFQSDGTFSARGEDESVSGSYSVDGDTISGTVPGYTFQGSVTEDTMIITDSEENTATLARQ